MVGREKIQSGMTLYRGVILNLRVDKVLTATGKEAVREVVEHAPAVAMLPVDHDGRIYLIRQYRYALEREILEIPAGLVEDGEDFERCAERELQEEIGFFPGKLKEIGQMYNSPGFCTEKLVLYLATDLKPSKLPEDEDESICLHPLSEEEAKELLQSGEIVDGKTFAALSWYFAFGK